jgi:monoterpene epsilon-lactone hydrolase
MPDSSIRRRKARPLLPPLAALVLFVVVAVSAFWVVLFRRLLRGRRHPGWGFRKEVVAEIGRNTTQRLINVTVPELRERLMPNPISLRARWSVRHQRSTHGSNYAEIFTPKGWTETGPTLLYFHGGGYIAGSPATHRDLLARIARAGQVRCIAVDYRKAPEYPYPTPVDDGEDAYHFLLASGTPAENVFIGGDSAGGGLALAVLMRVRDAQLPAPRGGVLLSPWVDLQFKGESIHGNAKYDYLTPKSLGFGAELYLQGHDPAHPEVSPIHGNLTGLPPLLIQTGDAELFFSENKLLARRAEAAGVLVTHEIEPNMVHVFQLFASFVPECGPAIGRIGMFIQQRMAVPANPPAHQADLLAAG